MSIINAILLEPGKDPSIYKLSGSIDKQIEEISAIVDGNFISSRLFQVGTDVSMHIFVNDMAIPLRLRANRRFPQPEQHEIIFGNALFLVMDDTKGDEEGPLDMPDHICQFFIEKLKEYFEPCSGDEIPDPKTEIFVENAGTAEEKRFKWVEVDRPSNDFKFIGTGYVRIVDDGECNIIETKGRYFKQDYLPSDKQ